MFLLILCKNESLVVHHVILDQLWQTGILHDLMRLDHNRCIVLTEVSCNLLFVTSLAIRHGRLETANRRVGRAEPDVTLLRVLGNARDRLVML